MKILETFEILFHGRRVRIMESGVHWPMNEEEHKNWRQIIDPAWFTEITNARELWHGGYADLTLKEFLLKTLPDAADLP